MHTVFKAKSYSLRLNTRVFYHCVCLCFMTNEQQNISQVFKCHIDFINSYISILKCQEHKTYVTFPHFHALFFSQPFVDLPQLLIQRSQRYKGKKIVTNCSFPQRQGSECICSCLEMLLLFLTPVIFKTHIKDEEITVESCFLGVLSFKDALLTLNQFSHYLRKLKAAMVATIFFHSVIWRS